MTFNSRRAGDARPAGDGVVSAAGHGPVPSSADPFNGVGGDTAGRDRRPRSPELLTLVPVLDVATVLAERHYLGPAKRGIAWRDQHGVLVLANPSSRRLPHDRWLELTRWCLDGARNGGSKQWADVRAWLLAAHPEITTVVSYSDPSVGHTGALYRACGWLWAPTWHRLRTPPTGQGRWRQGGKIEAAKDRWVDVLRPDGEREPLLVANDAAVCRRYPWAVYREPRFRRGRPVRGTGGGDYGRWTR